MENTFDLSTALSAAKLDYAAAIEFLKTKGPLDKRVVRIYGRKQTGTGESKVRQRLAFWAAKQKPANIEGAIAAATGAKAATKGAEAVEKTVVTVPFQGNFTVEEFDALPEKIQKLEKVIKGAHTIRSYHRGQLRPTVSPEDRAESTRMIAQATDQITEAQAQIDFFKKNGITTTSEEETDGDGLPNDLVEVIRLLGNCVSRISKLTKALEKAPTNAAKIKKMEEEQALKLALTTKKALLENATPNA